MTDWEPSPYRWENVDVTIRRLELGVWFPVRDDFLESEGEDYLHQADNLVSGAFAPFSRALGTFRVSRG